MTTELSNAERNRSAQGAIDALERSVDLGAQAQKQTGIALGHATLDVAESLQILQHQFVETSLENRRLLEDQVNKLIESNEKTARSNEHAALWSKWLGIAMIAVTLLIGLLQVYVIWVTSESVRSARSETTGNSTSSAVTQGESVVSH